MHKFSMWLFFLLKQSWSSIHEFVLYSDYFLGKVNGNIIIFLVKVNSPPPPVEELIFTILSSFWIISNGIYMCTLVETWSDVGSSRFVVVVFAEALWLKSCITCYSSTYLIFCLVLSRCSSFIDFFLFRCPFNAIACFKVKPIFYTTLY